MLAASMILEETSNVAQVEKLKGALERITTMNEIAYQSMFFAINASAVKARDAKTVDECFRAVEDIRTMFDRCRRASDEIDRLSRKGIDIVENLESK
jgi:hypothetical protein